jgi:cytochrome c oxidase subunit 2
MTGFSDIPQLSAYAAAVDLKFIVLTVLSGLIAGLVFTLVVVFSIRYRRGSPASRATLPGWMQRDIEVGWTVATGFTFLFIFWWMATAQLSALTQPKTNFEIHIEAKQWMWKVEQPNGAREINEIHVPSNTDVRLVMSSDDVIHSLFLPALRLKRDVLPGRYTYIWFNADRPGTYNFMCTQFCGTDHARMIGRFIVMSPENYARWSGAQPEADDLARQGAGLFVSLGCSGCHAPGSRVHAPDLHGLYGRQVPIEGGSVVTADEAYIRDCILLNKHVPAGYPPVMPRFQGIVSEAQTTRLVAYIKSLTTETQQQGASP